MKTVPTAEKENLINLAYEAVRSGLANGDYLDIEDKVKAIMSAYLQEATPEEQTYLLREFIGYIRKRVQVPGGRLGAVALIKVGKARNVPLFLTNCATAIWGTFFSNKANSARLKQLFLD
jgi:hypothetical protein